MELTFEFESVSMFEKGGKKERRREKERVRAKKSIFLNSNKRVDEPVYILLVNEIYL